VEERMLAQAEGAHPQLALATSHLLSSGGKRMRVAITLLTGEMLNGDRDKLVTLAAAFEMLHSATLVHDDLIDGSLLRRGIPTLNSQWSTPATVLTGDFIFARAALLAAEVNLVPVMQLFAQTLATIVNGEITQLFGRQSTTGRVEYNQRIYAKTASLFETATHSAAIVSRSAPDILEIVKRYGYEVGMAFQIVDDILDFTGEQEAVGKPVASDLRQGVITLPVLYYQELSPRDAVLNKIINGQAVSEEQMIGLINSIRLSGAVEQAMKEASDYVNRSQDLLSGFSDSLARRGLEELARYVIQRSK
jgi:geranylgeranyl pyrophosphate synthase